MQPDPEYLRRHYSSLSDDALLAIDRDELVETAQQCYDAELNTRDLPARSSVRKTVRAQVPTRSNDLSDEEVEAEGDSFETGDSPDWLDEAAEVYSVVAAPGTTAEDAASGARNVLEAADIPCHLELIETPEEKIPPTNRWRLLVPGNFHLQATSTLERDIFNHEFEAGWKTFLEVLSDDELLEVSPEVVLCGLFDRIERVTRTYEEEVARRRL
jgi:hypothetical protein